MPGYWADRMPKPPEKPKAGAGKPTKAPPAGKAKGAPPTKGAPPAKAPTKAGGGKGAPAKAAPANTPPTEEPLEEKSMYHHKESPSEKKLVHLDIAQLGGGGGTYSNGYFPQKWVFGGRLPLRSHISKMISLLIQWPLFLYKIYIFHSVS